MTNAPTLILKEDGFPVTALMTGAMGRVIAPQNAGTWVCLQIHTQAHEPPEVQSQMSQYLPPQTCQIALDPASAHQLGQYLIALAHDATAPE
jgi:hypothetical protein